MLYVGIREAGTPPLTYGAAPTGTARLTDDIVAMGLTFDTAWFSAVRRGVTAEDHSHGYALSSDSAVRAVQDQFIDVAAQRMDLLRTVLRRSADAQHRALAASIVAYGADRKTIAPDLLHAVDDPDDGVRNNAVRALWVLGEWANQHPEAAIDIPADAFIEFLNSVSWSERNKGVLVLMSLTASLDEPGTRARVLSDSCPHCRSGGSESIRSMAGRGSRDGYRAGDGVRALSRRYALLVSVTATLNVRAKWLWGA
jgi:hypothetical protein